MGQTFEEGEKERRKRVERSALHTHNLPTAWTNTMHSNGLDFIAAEIIEYGVIHSE